LLDGLQHEATAGVFSQMDTTALLVEIGCGTGVVSVYLASHIKTIKESGGHEQPIVLVTDINPKALMVARATAKANSSSHHPLHVEAIECDLLSALLPRMEHSVDILLFNPPYVPTPDDEVGGNGIEASWAGGQKGRRVIDRAIPQIARALSHPQGVAYMITVDDNEPEQLAASFRELGLLMTPLVRRREHNEFLTVQKICWIT
jgi:release factor glutamine methyltransferase